MEFGDYIIDVDVERTRAFYETASGEGCTCQGCRNYPMAVETLPEPVREFFHSLGIDPKKPAETYVNCTNEDGTLLYGGWFHICGTLIRGELRRDSWYSVLSRFQIAFTEKLAIVENNFPAPILQMEFFASLPWMLDEPNTYPIDLLPTKEFSGLSEEECIQIQERLSGLADQRDWAPPEKLRTVAGVDLAYWRSGRREWAVCCIVVLELAGQTVIEKQHAVGPVTFPYIPGCLAFRELPLVKQAYLQLEHLPDLYIFDGNGLLHPRSMGLATHASFYLNAPTFGVAKSYYRVEGARWKKPGVQAGSCSDITLEGRVLGRAVRTHTGVRPVFVSVGSGVSLDTATALTLSLTGKDSHIPLPTRYADLETHAMRELYRTSQT